MSQGHRLIAFIDSPRGPTLYAEPLRTDRLDVVPLRAEHAPEMAEVLADPALHTFIGGSPATPQALRTRYEHLVAGSPDPTVTWCNWVLRLREHHPQDSRLIGTVQATITPGAAEAEIAWVIGSPWQGHGYAAEAAHELVTWLTTRQPPIRTIMAHIHPDHHASAAVARAAGLHPTDEHHDGELRWRLTR
ncbi:GNAT family N-acetyltransferase [Streptomyces sp. NPDC014006]|uniref:GNAT family N-acetyltransferase n=1 Tax=Streptomyces sp. NPDC014006 TaxID=3364870 RepID=UPI0036F5B3A5